MQGIGIMGIGMGMVIGFVAYQFLGDK